MLFYIVSLLSSMVDTIAAVPEHSREIQTLADNCANCQLVEARKLPVQGRGVSRLRCPSMLQYLQTGPAC